VCVGIQIVEDLFFITKVTVMKSQINGDIEIINQKIKQRTHPEVWKSM
jgi:hypothetical protein